MWGEDGMDGDGVEYIFFVASDDLINSEYDEATKRTKITLKKDAYYDPQSSPFFIPTTKQQIDDLKESYQVDEWISNVDNNWTDNPSDIDSTQPYEFVAMRKYDGKAWGPFSTPALWASLGGITVNPTSVVYGSTNYRPYTCYAFYREPDTKISLEKYSVIYDFSAFGTAEKPNPSYSDLSDDQRNLFYEHPQDYSKTLDADGKESDIVWEDTVPTGDGNLWLITAHIGDEHQSTDTG